MKTIVLPAALVLMWVSAESASGPQRSVPIHDRKDAIECVLERSDGSRETLAPPFRISCADAGSVARCSFRAAEPADIPVRDVCAAGPQAGVSARTLEVDLRLRGAEPLVVQWLRPRPDGGLHVSAERSIQGPRPTVLLVDEHDRSLLRFKSAGRAPFSIAVAQIPKTAPWVLPAPVAGGELFIRVGDAPVIPIAVRLTGPDGRLVELSTQGRLFWARGLAKGRYHAARAYTGGAIGESIPIDIEPGETSDVYWPPAAVAGVRVTVDQALCLRALGLRISRRTETAFGDATLRSAAIAVEKAGVEDCRWHIEGLAVGQYLIEVVDSDGQLASSEVDLVPQAIEDLRLHAAVVDVGGRVFLNQKPVDGVLVGLTSVGSRGGREQAAEVRTDSLGFYRGTVGRPGVFGARFQADGFALMGQERIVTLSEGWNEVDWHLSGGTINLRVSGWDRASDLLVSVAVEDPGRLDEGGSRMLSQTRVVDANRPLPIRVLGLGWGGYRISATQRRPGLADKVSTIERVTVSERSPDASLTLDLTENTAALRVVDESGAPVSPSAVVGPNGPLAEIEPGVFSLSGTHPGGELRVVAPGFTGACRRAPSSGALWLPLTRGRTAEVHFSAGMKSRIPEAFVRPDGSECDLLLWSLAFQVAAEDEAGATRFLISNFPSAGLVRLLSDSGGASVKIPAEGVVWLPVSRDDRPN